MLDLKPKTRNAGTSFWSRQTTLAVSWLNNQFCALAIHRGQLEGAWEHTTAPDGSEPFAPLLQKAIEKTGYRGHEVTLVIAHPRLVQQIVEVPPVRGRGLMKILARQAQQQKMFPGEAAWSIQGISNGADEQKVLMHLIPKVLVNQLVQACEQHGLTLTLIAPPSAVLATQLKQLPLGKSEMGLIAAETGGSTTVLVGTQDGQVLVARTLPGTWNESPERLGVDLNRTLLFVTQQYGSALNKGIWLFGEGAAEKIAVLQKQLQLPLQNAPSVYDPYYWALEASKLRPATTPNFISPEMQQAAKRLLYARVVAVATLLVVFALWGLAGYGWMQTRREQANAEKLSQWLTQLQNRQAELVQKSTALTRKQQMATLVLDAKPSPAPVWFLGYLSEAVPTELVITNLHVRRLEEGWHVELGGTYQEALGQPTISAMNRNVETLKSRLAEGPFHVRLIEPKERAALQPKPKATGSAIAAWVANLASGVQAKPAPTFQFNLEGMMR